MQDQSLSHCYSEFEETATKSYSILDWIKDYFEMQAEKKMSMSVSKERKKSWVSNNIFISKPDIQVNKRTVPTVHMKLKNK